MAEPKKNVAMGANSEKVATTTTSCIEPFLAHIAFILEQLVHVPPITQVDPKILFPDNSSNTTEMVNGIRAGVGTADKTNTPEIRGLATSF